MSKRVKKTETGKRPETEPQPDQILKQTAETTEKTAESECAVKVPEQTLLPEERMSLWKRVGCAGWLAIGLSLGVVILSVVLTAVLVLPAAVEKKINVLLATMAQNGRMTVEVKDIGLFRTDFAFYAIPQTDGDSVWTSSLESCTIRYSPLDLVMRKHINSITIHGANVPATLRGRELKFPFMGMLKQSGSGKDGQGFKPDRLPVTVGQVAVDGMVSVNMKKNGGAELDDAALLPFNCVLTAQDEHWRKLSYQVVVNVSGNALAVTGEYDMLREETEGTGSLFLDTRLLPYALRSKLPENVNGSVVLKVDYCYNVAERRLIRCKGESRSSLQAGESGGLRIKSNPDFHFSAGPDSLLFSCTGIRGEFKDIPFNLSEITAGWDGQSRTVHGDAVLGVGNKPDLRVPFTLSRTPAQELKLEARLAPAEDGAVSAREFKQGGWTAGSELPEGNLSVVFGKEISFQADGMLKKLSVKNPKMELRADTVSVSASGTWTECRAEVRAAGLDAVFAAGQTHLQLPEAVLSAGRRKDHYAGLLIVPHGSCELPLFGLKLEELSCNIPVVYPDDGAGEGAVKAGRILLWGRNMGSAKASTMFEKNRLMLVGSAELFKLNGEFASTLSYDGGLTVSNSLLVPLQPVQENFGLGDLFAGQIGDKRLDGKVELAAQYNYEKGAQNGNCKFRLTEGTISSKESDLMVSGVELRVNLPHLPEMATRPNQVLSFKQLQCGTIRMDSGRVHFRMESPKVWYVERLLLNWCGGKIRMESTCFNPESRRMPLTVHCDRLNLVDFLLQTGVGKGSGNGSARISGTIPVVFRQDGTLTFRDGFLYSTPGEEGSIKLELSDTIKSTQAASTSFDMTQEALRDFKYSWAKVQMSTENDLLKLKMQLNGKPAKPLYYTYANGGFVKTPTPHVFQGILLDVNFSLPLSAMMQLMNGFNSVLKN